MSKNQILLSTRRDPACRARSRAWRPVSLVLLAWMLAAGAHARQPEVMEGRWMVKLADQPSLAFMGSDGQLIAGASPAMRLAPTAPAATGEARFDPSAKAVRNYTVHLDQRRAEVLDAAGFAIGRDVQPLQVFRHVANGFSAQLTEFEAAELARLPGVRSVEPVFLHHLHADEGPGAINAPALWQGLAGQQAVSGEGMVIGIIDTGINWDSVFFDDNPPGGSHVYSNPYGSGLGLCADGSVPCNDKLVGVWDFTTEGTDGFDPIGHGSHVASIAAGNSLSFSAFGWNFTVSGVAPHAHLISYKVCYESLPDDPNNAGCSGDAIMAAFEQAVIDGVDVVNYSIGGGAVSPWLQATALLNFWSAGIPFVSSVGNDGPGPGTISSPANAPWVMSVGSSTHRRWIGHRATILGGLSARFLVYGTGPALQSTLSSRTLIVADEVAADQLACAPFPEGALSNAVVLIRRGDCTFETKVMHAAQAGAIAVLVYNDQPGLPIVMGGLEGSSIPAAMMSHADGVEAVAFLADRIDPRVTLNSDEAVMIKPEKADMMAEYSARGPSPAAGHVMKPNVVAPGGQVVGNQLGAGIVAAGVPEPGSIMVMQGTSMASPNVAGAVALLRQLHPAWTPDILQSTLETTAAWEPVTWLEQPATQLDRGAGRIRVDQAARAGLYLPVSQAEFLAANPAQGGDPGELNLAGIFSSDCADTCTTQRTVRALQDGSWTVTVSGDLAVSVTPDSFSLDAGEQQQLEITFAVADDNAAGVVEGRIVLTPAANAQAVQTLPVGVMVDQTRMRVSANRGGRTLTLGHVPALPQAIFETSPLVRPQNEQFTLAQDPTRNNPYAGGTGTRTFLVDVPPGTLLLMAETLHSDAPDIDLFVGRDTNGNGQADASEEICASTTPDELEQCLIEHPEPGTWWVLVQNWQASADGAEDEVTLDIAVLSADDSNSSLVVSGPGRHPGGLLNLNLYWDQPAMGRDERWLAAVGISSTPDELGDIGVFPVSLTRTRSIEPALTALFDGQPLDVVLPPDGVHEQLFIDVPPTAEQLEVFVLGQPDVEARLRRVSYDELAGWAPGTPVPDSPDLATGSGSEVGIELSLGGSQDPLSPGRYHVILTNTGSEERLVHVQADLIQGQGMTPRVGLWSPRGRLIYQGIDWGLGADAALVWYTYDEDGLPAFYLAGEQHDPDTAVWRAPLYRVTSNRQRQSLDTVGEVALTAIDETTSAFSWRLNGAHGSELLISDVPQTCPEVDGVPASYSGLWFYPDAAIGGTSAVVTDQVEVFIRYFFDDDGVGRWVYVFGDLPDDTLEVREFRGFCPNCPSFAMSYEDSSAAVGTYSITFDSEVSGIEVMEFTLQDPLNHQIEHDVPVVKLTHTLACQP